MINLTKSLKQKYNNTSYILHDFHIQFVPGYSYNNTEDRYVSKITFGNKQTESITMKLDLELSQKILNLISDELEKNIDKLSNDLKTKIFK